MKQIKSALLFSMIVSLCVAPAAQAIDTQNLKQKAKGLGWSALSVSLATLSGFAASRSWGMYENAYNANRPTHRYHHLDHGNLNALLTGLTAYFAYKSGQKAVQAFQR